MESFDIVALRRLLCPADDVPQETDGVVICDYALSDNPRSDLTAMVASRVQLIEEKHFWITDCKAGKYDALETAYQISQFIGRNKPDRTLIERLSGWQYLQNEVIRQAEKYQTELPVLTFFKPSKKPDSKRDRILLFKQACDEQRVHFVYSNWNESLFESLCGYTGEKKNRGKRDDLADCCGYLALFG